MRTTPLLALALLFASGCLMIPQQGAGAGAPAGGSGASGAPAAPAANAAATEGSPAAPQGPQIDSLTLHNDCAQTVKLFLGAKPKWGSGTSTTIGSNVTQSFTLNPGDSVWIVNGSDEGVVEYKGVAGMHRMKIPSSCTAFAND